MKNSIEILKLIKKFKLEDNEIKILLCLNKFGTISAQKISREINIPKTTVYHSLTNMLKEGFIVIVKTSRGNTYSIVNNAFLLKVESERKRIANLESSIKEITTYLNNSKHTSRNESETKVYYGLEGTKQLIWNLLSSKSEIYYYTSADRKKLFGKSWFIKYCLEFVNRNLHEKGFENETNFPIDPKEYFKETNGYLERSKYIMLKGMSFNGEIYIYDDIYSYYTWEGTAFYGVEIKNQFLARTQRTIFENFWKLSINSNMIIATG